MAQAGTTKKGDVLVAVELTLIEGIDLRLTSKVINKYGESIKQSVKEILAEFGIKAANIIVEDNGALDFVIRARVETAIKRALAEV